MQRRGARKAKAQGRRSNDLYVGIVAASASIREALVHSIGGMKGFRAVDCGSGNAESVARVRDLGIRLVLTSLDPGPASSLALALRDADPRIRTVVLLRGESRPALEHLAAV